jgi:transposase-like protein
MAGSRAKRDEGKERFWRGEIEAQARNGGSVRAYCRAHRLRESTFYFWRRELARRRPAAFVPVTVADETAETGGAASSGVGDAPSSRIEILVGNGRRVQVTGPVDRRALADVLAVVEGRPC